MKFTVAFVLGLATQLARAVHLTESNYDELTAGKTWCGHCKKLKPDWDKLMEEFADLPTQLVAEVDCTSEEGKPLCTMAGIKGYPTLMYGHPADLQKYTGARIYKNLLSFAQKNLGPMCSPTQLDLCSDAQKAEFSPYLAMTTKELKALVDEKQAAIKQAEAECKELKKDLKRQEKEANRLKEEKIEAIKASGLATMKKVLQAAMEAEENAKKDEL